MRNRAQLIAYVDRFSGGGFAELNRLLKGPLAGSLAEAPPALFRYIDGLMGFDRSSYAGGSRLGTWEDVQTLGSTIDIVADLIANHVSSSSPQFLISRAEPVPSMRACSQL